LLETIIITVVYCSWLETFHSDDEIIILGKQSIALITATATAATSIAAATTKIVC